MSVKWKKKLYILKIKPVYFENPLDYHVVLFFKADPNHYQFHLLVSFTKHGVVFRAMA